MTQYGEMMYTSFDTNPHSHCALVYLSGGFTLAGQFSSHPCPVTGPTAAMKPRMV